MRHGLLFSLLAVALALAGCDQAEPITSADAPVASLETTVLLNGYQVTFLGSTSGPDGVSFSYEVMGVAPGPPALDWFFLENACGVDAVALEPPNAVVPAIIDGVPGYKWNSGLGVNETRTYAYTFTEAALGVARVKLRRGGVVETAELPGPCGGLAELAGSVFVNGDDDPERAANELGLGNVQVEIYDGEPGGADPVASATTGPDGAFSFTLLKSGFTDAGFYTVYVPEAAASPFNAVLYGSYDYVLGGVAQPQVVLDDDVSGLDLGFDPDRDQIIVDLSEGAFQTNARPPRELRRFVRDAQRNRPCDSADPEVICREALVSHLRDIVDDTADPDDAFYLLSNPFQGPAGASDDDLLDWALDRLSGNPKPDVEAVAQKLLAMQINNENGWGTGDPGYEDALQSYLEEWVDNNGGLRIGGGGDPEGPGGGGGTTEELMTDAYLRIGGGGGTVEE
ncbi:MAG: hypothetical protein R3181_06885 [Rubricoccaceae bacterium]|nr:hypothetical protein [Rubricoccaceae bacterium]